MSRVKEIEDKQLAPRLDVDASKRFVRNALWNAAQKSSTPTAVKSTSLFNIICCLMAIKIHAIFTSALA